MAVYITKNAYFDTIKRIEIYRVLPVDLELRNVVASIYK